MKAVVALGSNLGDRRAHLAAGLVALRTLGAVVPSPLVMETPDESGMGPAYLNTVALVVTEEADPCRFLEALLRLELQADCFAGVWAYHANNARQLLEQGDVEEAINAAARIGDDALVDNFGRQLVMDARQYVVALFDHAHLVSLGKEQSGKLRASAAAAGDKYEHIRPLSSG